MSTSPDPAEKQSENTYIIDAEDAAEMARLLDQDKLLTEAMGGLFPERAGGDMRDIHDVLDIGCGPGGWIHEVAHSYPNVEATGIDISQRMVQYARAHAKVRKLNNAHFKVMDAHKRLDFPDNSFDLVNERFLFSFMTPDDWHTLARECMRILRPGGIIRFTEVEAGFSNMPAFERIFGVLFRALHLAGQSFSPNGQHIGLIPMLKRIMRDAGYQDIQHLAHMVDFSAGTPGNRGFHDDLDVGFKLAQPFLTKTKAITPEEFDVLYPQAMDEMLSEEFCGVWMLLTAWGRKP